MGVSVSVGNETLAAGVEGSLSGSFCVAALLRGLDGPATGSFSDGEGRAKVTLLKASLGATSFAFRFINAAYRCLHYMSHLFRHR
jgi:hypothetical protein